MQELQKVPEVPGLYYIDNLDGLLDTTDTIKLLDKLKWVPLSSSIHSRKVQHYGYKYDYKTYKINQKTTDLPICLDKFKEFLTDICKSNGIIDEKYDFNQCIVNNYYSGQGISKHIDVKSYGDIIGCYSLSSGATLRFSLDDKVYEIYTKPDSLYIMTGNARYKWLHEMVVAKYDIVGIAKVSRGRRVSITFRNIP